MRLRVLVVTPIYPWPGDPPEGIFVHRQIKNLVRLGVECRVLTYRPAVRGLSRGLVRMSWLRYHPRWITWPPHHDGVRVAHAFYHRRLNRTDDVIPAIGEALIRFVEKHSEFLDTDVIYAHWLWTGGAAALELREHFGWPVAAIARGSDMHFWQTIHPHCRRHVDRVLKNADMVLANCDGLRRRAEEISSGAAAFTQVIYNGCDAKVFRPPRDRKQIRELLGLPQHARILLCCASLTDRKGIAELAEAWRMFSLRSPAWHLIVVGRTVQRDLVEKLRSSGAGPVTLVGPVPAERVGLYMQAADAYVQPSRLEGLANATMEAMATALPVIATDTCGQREAVRNGENGWLVPPGDSVALATAMEAMSRDHDRALRLGAAARQTIENSFDPIAHATRLRSLLTGLAQRRAQSRSA